MAKVNKQQPVVKGKAQPAKKQMSSDDLRKKYEDAKNRASSGDINNIKLDKGENIVRIVSNEFEENYVVFVKDTEGKDRKINMGIDPNKNKEKYAIIFETMPDAKAQHRYYFKAVTGKSETIKKDGKTIKKTILDNEVRLLEVGPSVFKQIAAVQIDDEYPNIDEINLKITRTGEKLKTEYTVMPTPTKSPLPADLVGDIDLTAVTEETPLKTVYEILGEDYDAASAPSDDDDDLPDYSDEDEPDEDEPKETESDDLAELSRKELKELIKSEGHEITIYKSWEDDQIRDAIRDARKNKSEDEPDEDEPEETESDEDLSDDVIVGEDDDDDDDLADLDDLADDDDDTPPPPKKVDAKKKKK